LPLLASIGERCDMQTLPYSRGAGGQGMAMLVERLG
jgi:hypothetical protein